MRKKANSSSGGDEGLFGAKPAARIVAAPVAPAAAAAPHNLVEYTPLGEMGLWRVEKFVLLAAEFDVTPQDLPEFHDAAKVAGKAWVVCQRLYGMKPVLLPMKADPEDYRTLETSELAAMLGIAVKAVSQELDVIRGVWLTRRVALGRSKPVEVAASAPTQPAEEFSFKDEDILKRHRFPMEIFRYPGRSMDEAQLELEWFLGRIEDYGKMLEDKVAGPIARQTLLAELDMQRLELEKFKYAPGTKDAANFQKDYESASSRYRGLLRELNTFFPLATAIANKNVFHGQLADIITGYQQYYANDDRHLFDGMFTAQEIQVECRRTKQVPEPQYRAGITVMTNAARAGLWDPKWKMQFSPRQLARLDRAWKKALSEEEEKEGIEPTDLLSDDPEKGEFPEIYTPRKGTEQP